MQIIEKLKKINRTLLEMYIGITAWGIVCCVVGVFFVDDPMKYCLGIGYGVLLAMVSIWHMYRTLDRALDYEGKTASNIIFRGYLTRYVLFAVILFILMVTEVLNPLVVFLAYIGIKVTAFIQPITHKLCTKMFHEK